MHTSRLDRNLCIFHNDVVFISHGSYFDFRNITSVCYWTERADSSVCFSSINQIENYLSQWPRVGNTKPIFFSHNRLISAIEFTTVVRRHLYIGLGPGSRIEVKCIPNIPAQPVRSGNFDSDNQLAPIHGRAIIRTYPYLHLSTPPWDRHSIWIMILSFMKMLLKLSFSYHVPLAPRSASKLQAISWTNGYGQRFHWSDCSWKYI